MEKLIFPNQGHLKKNGLYRSFPTKEHIAYISLVWEIKNKDPINVIRAN